MSENAAEMDTDQGDGYVFIDGAHFGSDGKMIVTARGDGFVEATIMESDVVTTWFQLTPDEAHWLGTKLRLAAKKARS